MGFEKFGYKSFTSQTKVDAFVNYLENGELRGTKCKHCGKTYFPPRADCAGCFGNDMEWIAIEGSCNLISYTRANFAPTGFEGDVPYTLALVDINGIKVFGRLSQEVSDDELKVGLELRVVINSLLDEQLAYEFVKL